MRTPDMSDEELDALFQRGAENYPDEHNLSAWLQMERKLDEAAVQQLVRGRVLRIFALEVAVVAVALLVWFGFSGLKSQVITAQAPTQTTTQPTAQAGVTARPQVPTATVPQPTRPRPASPLAAVTPAELPRLNSSSESFAQASAGTVAPSGRAAAPHRSRRLPLLLSPSRKARPALASAGEDQTSASGVVSGLVSTSNPRTLLGSAYPEQPTRQQGTALKPAASAPTDAPGRTTATLTPGADAAAPSSAETVAPETAVAAATQPGSEPLPDRTSGATLAPDSVATSTPGVAPAAVSALESAPADSVREAQKPTRNKPAYRLSIGGLYAPELSTVGCTKTTSPGSNLGIQVEYRFTDRLRLNVAAIRSMKRYVARGSDYTVPAGTWNSNYTIDQVDAVCRITDLPINLRYDVIQHERSAMFVSAGLTSLLMRDEQYSYDYEYYGKYYSRDWHVSKGSNHWLSVVNLSAGYEHNLANRWSGQVEPFVKVPLGGVGFGKVKLSSAGVFLSLKYHLLPSKGPH